MKHAILVGWLTVTMAAATASNAVAQSTTGDAREVGLGGVAFASRILQDSAGGSSPQFVVPLGLLQLLSNRESLKVKSGTFDPSLALEYSAVPTHWVFGRNPSPPRARFIADIRDASLSPDLNAYRGFVPAATLSGAGVLARSFGKAFTVHRTPRVQQQLFAGAGPYLAIQTTALFDQRLVNMLGASSATYVPSSSLHVGNQSLGQAAAQITGGYRAQLGLTPAGGRLELGADYNHLHGFRYEDVDIDLRLDTDSRGFSTLDTPQGAPLGIDRLSSRSGRGYSVDLNATAIFDRWRVGLRADGLGNRIDWTGVTHREYAMPKLTGGAKLATLFSAPDADRRVTLPVQLRLQGAYRDSAWGAIAELERGLQGTAASAGLERRFSWLELRAGGRLVHRVVLPGAGFSLRAGHTWFDVGSMVTTANIERKRNVILATSLRFAFGGPAAAPATPLGN